jgi:fluoride ion exporter CrcB/FEX
MENVVLLQQKQIADFALYTSISLLFCLLAAGLGVWVGNKVW